jgi:hypothetical protein
MHTAVYDLAQLNSLGRAGIRNGNVRSDIDPSFENDPEIVSMPPGELASCDRSKIVERDVKIYRKKPEFV